MRPAHGRCTPCTGCGTEGCWRTQPASPVTQITPLFEGRARVSERKLLEYGPAPPPPPAPPPAPPHTPSQTRPTLASPPRLDFDKTTAHLHTQKAEQCVTQKTCGMRGSPTLQRSLPEVCRSRRCTGWRGPPLVPYRSSRDVCTSRSQRGHTHSLVTLPAHPRIPGTTPLYNHL
jgi:hypothetical protein